MRRPRSPGTALLLGVALMPLGCADARSPAVSRAHVERVLRTLAADDMRGRLATGDAIGRAAEFLSGEFAEMGLEPLPGLDGYLQPFPVHGFRVTSTRVEIDGNVIPRDRILVSARGPDARWDTEADVEVIRVGATDSPAALMQPSGRSALVLVDSSHAAALERIRPLVERIRYSTADEPGPVRVYVLGGTDARSFSVRVTADPVRRELANVVGRIPGRREDEIVLFSAHYDHIGILQPVDGDSIANGANDDASGTTAVVELARAFSALGPQERTLMFAAFTAEEAGGLGSRIFSERVDPDRIVAMLNIEMIGKPAASGPNTAWMTGWDRSSLGEILTEAVEGTEYAFTPDPYPDQNLFYRSDNATLARLGVPAHSLSTTPIDVDPDYHQVSDEVETLDLDHMTNTIRALAAGARPLITGERTPTRVDTSAVN